MKKLVVKTGLLTLRLAEYAAIILLLFIGMIHFGYYGRIPSTQDLLKYQNEAGSQILSKKGVLLATVHNKNRISVPFEQIPQHTIDALVATEDARFFEHNGVDSRSLLRVLIKSILFNQSKNGGGSTISQQLAKNMFGRQDYDFLHLPVNKYKEIVLAKRLEEVYSKEEILELYLNTVPFGENVYGIEAAAQRYFNKAVSELTTTESATLVGMLKANSYYNPHLHPKRALKRRNVVLSQMEKYGYIDSTQHNIISSTPLNLDYTNRITDGPANYFTYQVQLKAQHIIDSINNNSDSSYHLETDGLIIYTTLDFQKQQYAINAMNKHLSHMQKRLDQQYNNRKGQKELAGLIDQVLKNTGMLKRKDSITYASFDWDSTSLSKEITVYDSIRKELLRLHCGIVAMNPVSGSIEAYVGGINFVSHPYDQAKAFRPMASTFKPILYSTALENGRTPCDYISNRTFTLTDYDNWKPQNYDGTEGGKYSITGALVNSVNIPTLRLYFQTDSFSLNQLWKDMKFSREMAKGPSAALGTSEVNLRELVTAYSSFANHGMITKPYMIEKITTKDGTVLFAHNNNNYKTYVNIPVIGKETARNITSMLKKAVNEGTGVSMRQKYHVKMELAGKTGTSQHYKDAWFVGYNKELVIAARVGTNNPAVHFNNGINGSGSRLALPVVAYMLQSLEADPNFESITKAKYDSLPEWTCPDYKPETFASRLFTVFSKPETTLEAERKKAKRRIRKFPFFNHLKE